MSPTARTRAALAAAHAALREAEIACRAEVGPETEADLARCRKLVETWTARDGWLDHVDRQRGAG